MQMMVFRLLVPQQCVAVVKTSSCHVIIGVSLILAFHCWHFNAAAVTQLIVRNFCPMPLLPQTIIF